mmetsp:Transcript_67558/g.134010  ORF Transcript_67558/g.134010 Transcript_67558/m.134010 type:complete len:231 (+) Transcript_67558:204-896(+)
MVYGSLGESADGQAEAFRVRLHPRTQRRPVLRTVRHVAHPESLIRGELLEVFRERIHREEAAGVHVRSFREEALVAGHTTAAIALMLVEDWHELKAVRTHRLLGNVVVADAILEGQYELVPDQLSVLRILAVNPPLRVTVACANGVQLHACHQVLEQLSAWEGAPPAAVANGKDAWLELGTFREREAKRREDVMRVANQYVRGRDMPRRVLEAQTEVELPHHAHVARLHL